MRDEHIGWAADDRRKRLAHVLDAYVLGALPPYNMLLPGGEHGVGIYSGQLYFVIKGIKTEADMQPEDRLTKELLERILGEAAVHEARHDGKDYFCAALEDWQQALGFAPKVKDA